MDIVAYIIGYTVMYAFVLFVALIVLTPIYWAFTAFLDVLSQYYFLWRKNSKPNGEVTFRRAFWSSYAHQDKIWGRIIYRIKVAHGFKATPPYGEWIAGG